MDGPPPTESTVNDQVDVVLPVLDEAEAIGWVLPRLPDGWRAIVVDNGSTDGSGDLARSLGATLVVEEQRGFGSPASRSGGHRDGNDG